MVTPHRSDQITTTVCLLIVALVAMVWSLALMGGVAAFLTGLPSWFRHAWSVTF